MLLHVKNMVCERCILIVRQQLERLNFQVHHISLGQVQISPEPDEAQLEEINAAFKALGFELLDNEKEKLVEQIKNQVIRLVHYSNLAEINQGLIHVVADALHKEPAYLSRTFSEVEGLTIEKYIIQQKIEKVKELLEYGEMNLNEISLQMGYSSSAHLSSQFKSVTGQSPSQYKSSSQQKRRALDQV